MIHTQLVDITNFDTFAPQIITAIENAAFIGLDCETQDSNRHQGLNEYCKYNEDTGKKAANTKLVFDMRRTIMTGFSLWPEGHDCAYYFNLNHADTENRIPWDKARQLLDARPETSYWVAHNANFEITVFASCYQFDVSERMIDTLQMAVTAYGPDEYSLESFSAAGIGDMAKWRGVLAAKANLFDPATQDMKPELADIVYKIIAKESDASHSYNGFVKEITYGYGLKKAVKTWFGHTMTTFEQVLGDKAHMGQLTGQEVADYGAEDAYWCLRLFRKLLEYMAQNCPDAINTFFEQENPMVPVFSEIWQNGMRVNTEAILSRRDLERAETAEVLRKMKAEVNKLLPFPDEPHADMFETEKAWYTKGWQKYRKAITTWAALPDSDDDFTQVSQCRGAVANAWRAEQKLGESVGPNFSHYMPIRTLMYDLLQQKVIRSEGKVQSDGNARGKMIDRLGGSELLACINKLAGIEQRMKLYLTPYSRLMDPETGCLYPVVSSELATRRMAASTPNPMQLAKRGESTYVRGFFKGDYDDHVIISVDWSGIELVIIGELSGDPEFKKAFGQLPHGDLHSGAAADILAVDCPGLTEESFKALKSTTAWTDFASHWELDNIHRLETDLKGQPLAPDKAYKYWRTEVGKGANFNFWYSGFLATVGERLGWSMDKTAAATDRYKARFAVAEDWRVNTIAQGQRDGYITLPDKTRRVRYEATQFWSNEFINKWQFSDDANYKALIRWITNKIQKRSYNQLVNAMVQGTCSTIAKRTVLKIREQQKALGWTNREFRFLMPIHDELLYSVHKDLVPEAVKLIRGAMINHPDIFKTMALDASPAVGLTFEPWNEKKAPYGQIELAEAPNLPFCREGKAMTDDEIRATVNYLYERKAYEISHS